MEERDEKGRFLPGNKGGTGKLPREYTEAFQRRIPIEKWDKIIDRAVKDALNGDSQARAWLADRLIGTAPKILDLQGGDMMRLRELIDTIKAKGLTVGVFVESALDAITEGDEEEGEDDA